MKNPRISKANQVRVNTKLTAIPFERTEHTRLIANESEHQHSHVIPVEVWHQSLVEGSWVRTEANQSERQIVRRLRCACGDEVSRDV